MSWWHNTIGVPGLSMGTTAQPGQWTTVTATATAGLPHAPQAFQGVVGGMTPPVHLRVPTMNDIQQSTVFSASITELVDLWRVRYGSEWVDANKLNMDNDGFYAFTAQRLLQYNLLEQHALFNPSYVTVYKLKDSTER